MVTYGVRNRPITFATVPNGYVEAGKHPDFRFGTVSYASPLSDEQVASFELVKIPSAEEREAFMVLLVERLKDAGWADEEFEPHFAHAAVGQAIADAGLHLKRDEVATEAFARLRGAKP
jgi:hypothetical protein